MTDALTYSLTAEGEEHIGACVNRLREWIDGLPQTAKVRIRITAAVKEYADSSAQSRTADMFKAGEVKDGVARKGRQRGRGKLRAIDGADTTPEQPSA